MPKNIFFPALMIFCFSCKDNVAQQADIVSPVPAVQHTNNPYPTVHDIPLPPGYSIEESADHSFEDWLGKMSLKKDKRVFKYDGTLKLNQAAQFAVLDISVGKENLQQCADAVMRLRAEFLFANKRFAEILFTDNEGVAYRFSAPYSREHFDTYLKKVFGMCGSASLAKQLHSITIPELSAGDVFIRGGFPGHAVIVIAVAKNVEGQKIFLLAQSYMPAQDIHILMNPMNDSLSPWYEVKENELIYTPEYTFRADELKR